MKYSVKCFDLGQGHGELVLKHEHLYFKLNEKLIRLFEFKSPLFFHARHWMSKEIMDACNKLKELGVPINARIKAAHIMWGLFNEKYKKNFFI